MAEAFTHDGIVSLLGASGDKERRLLERALQTKWDRNVHLRGLIELSNICTKDCLYCGVRRSNAKVLRYKLSREEVLGCAQMAYSMGYGSVALQGGERTDPAFVEEISDLVSEIKKIGGGALGITLSLGEQSPETYRRWFEAGAHRYLLRIETTNEELYHKIHPADHSFSHRLECLDNLLETGWQTGTGVMVGLPFQTLDHLADDLLFFKRKNFAMIGLGPYIPHPDTPLFEFSSLIPSASERMSLTLKMIAVLRLMMPRINMVAATANQTLDPRGREKAILAGANVIMPNMTPDAYREQYFLYPDKACVHDRPEDCNTCLELRLAAIGHRIQYNAWGDSPAFTEKRVTKKSKLT